MAWSAHALDAPTVVNITGHAFCNLAGAGSNHGHFLQLPASRYLPLAADICRQRRAGQCARHAVGLAATPPGGRRSGPALRSMAHGRRAGPLPGARRNRTVGALICRSAGPARLARSARPPGLRLAALLIKPISGRSMQLWSTAPGVQVYAGHGLKADPARDRGRGAEAEGWLWQPGDGICLEPMESPDKSALGKTAIDQNSETDGHADKKIGRRTGRRSSLLLHVTRGAAVSLCEACSVSRQRRQWCASAQKNLSMHLLHGTSQSPTASRCR